MSRLRTRGWWLRAHSAHVVMALCCLAGTSGALAQHEKAGGPDFEPAIQREMNLRGALVVRINVPQQLGVPVQVAVPVGEQLLTLDLSPHSVRDENYTLWEQQDDGTWVQLDPGPVNTFRGEVVGVPGSVVAGGVLAEGVSARIILDDQREYWIEPLSPRIEGAEPGLHVVYTHDNLMQGDWRCGNTDMPAPKAPHVADFEDGGFEQRGGTLYTAQLACDADFLYFQRYGGSFNVQNRIATIINTMNVAYEREVDIVHTITTTLVRASAAQDPYTTTDAATLNQQIESEWNGQGGIVKDVIQLFTGREISGNTIGRANHIGAICTSGGDPNCFSQSDFNGNFMSATDLSMHELGHLWDASHCACSNPASTMNPSITSINRFTFSDNVNNISQIVAYRNGRNCLSTGGGGNTPRNNDCSDAVPIGTGRFGFNNFGATTDPAPVPGACGSIGDDIWFTFRPVCDGTLSIDTCNNANEVGFDTVLAAYTGSCGDLTQVACNDDDSGCTVNSPARRSLISFAATAGTLYYIRVGGFSGANGEGILDVDYSSCPELPNDTCAGAITVSTCDSPVSFSTENADSEGFIEQNDCNFSGSSQIFNDIWYRVVAPCTGSFRVSTCGANFDTRIAVYTSCPSNINSALACNDDNGPACSGLDASVDFLGINGADYYIRVGSYSQTGFGSGSLTLTALACDTPANDSCLSPSPVSVGLNNISNVNACNNAAAGCGTGAAAVYYSFTAPDTCTYTVSTCGLASWDTVLAVYSSCFSLSPIACNDDGCRGTEQSILSFSATAGTSYLIRLAGFGGDTGTGQMRITGTAPSNDLCDDAQAVGLGSTPFSTHCAASESTNGCVTGAASVFFSFTSPVTALLNIDTCAPGRDFDTVLGVFANCGANTPLVCNDDTCGFGSRVELNAVAGTTYTIRVSGFGGDTGQATLRIGPANDECESPLAITNGDTIVNINGATQGGANIGCLIPFNDVWMRYTATCTGDATVNTCAGGTTFDTVLSVYEGTGCPVTPARQMGCNDDGCAGIRSSVTFHAVSGQDYLIRLSNFHDVAAGAAVVNVSCTPTACPCDFNGNGVLNSQDFFDFLACFFAPECTDADYNNSGAVNSQDFFDFLACFFAPPADCN